MLMAGHGSDPVDPKAAIGNIPSIRLSHRPALSVKEGIADTSWEPLGASQEPQ